MTVGKVSEEYDGIAGRAKMIVEQSVSVDCWIWTVTGMMISRNDLLSGF